MSWRDRLREASWRGIPFEVDSSSWSPGRNTVKHEFVQRDKPYVEDLGRKMREFTIDAWICAHPSNNFDPYPQRDLLINAFEQEGSGTLVHPYYGELTGNAVAEVRESGTDNGGYIKFVITFTESGNADFKSIATVDTLGTTIDAADAVVSIATQEMNTVWSVVGYADFVLKRASDGIESLSKGLQFASNLAKGNVSAWQQALTNLQLAEVNGIITSGFEISSNLSVLQQQVSRLIPPDPLPIAVSGAVTPDREQELANTQALNILSNTLYLSEFARRLAYLAVGDTRYQDDDSNIQTDLSLTSRQDVAKARLNIVELISELILDISDTDSFEDTRAQLVKLRSEISNHLTVLGSNLGDTFTDVYTIDMPALVIGYEHYGFLNDEEIVMRNEIPNPLFVKRNSLIEMVTSV